MIAFFAAISAGGSGLVLVPFHAGHSVLALAASHCPFAAFSFGVMPAAGFAILAVCHRLAAGTIHLGCGLDVVCRFAIVGRITLCEAQKRGKENCRKKRDSGLMSHNVCNPRGESLKGEHIPL